MLKRPTARVVWSGVKWRVGLLGIGRLVYWWLVDWSACNYFGVCTKRDFATHQSTNHQYTNHQSTNESTHWPR